MNKTLIIAQVDNPIIYNSQPDRGHRAETNGERPTPQIPPVIAYVY
jgi:hypothetical protein